MGSIGQTSTFSEHVHVTYQIKGNHEMQQHGSKYFARRPLNIPITTSLTLGSKGQSSTFSELGQVSYQSQEIPKCSNMLANILLADPPPHPTLGMWSMGQNYFFQNTVMLHIKLKGITKCSIMVAHILPANPPTPLGWDQ